MPGLPLRTCCPEPRCLQGLAVRALMRSELHLLRDAAPWPAFLLMNTWPQRHLCARNTLFLHCFTRNSTSRLFPWTDRETGLSCPHSAGRFSRPRPGRGRDGSRPCPCREHVLRNLADKTFDRPICEALLDQRFFNGIGNYLRAEILFR